MNRTPAEQTWDEFDTLPSGFADIRKTAADNFKSSGLPTRRVEEFKWTDLRRLIDQPYPPIIGKLHGDIDALIAVSPFAGIAKNRLVFINGLFDQARSKMPDDSNVTITTLSGKPDMDFSLKADDPLDNLNIAYASDGALIRISGKVKDPIELVYISSTKEPATVTTRNIIELDEGAEATILETCTGGKSAYVSNNATEIRLAKGARLDRVRLLDDGPLGIQLSNLIADLGENSKLADFTFIIGGRTVRNQGFATFTGQHAAVNISGAYMLKGKQHADTTLVIDHAVPSCESRELFKCVMDDTSRGVFQAKVIVARDAQKSDGQQTANALLLSDTAEFDAKPELEIYADDVLCGHGATSGDLDNNHLFYLMSRGIPESRARAMLIAAFASSSFEEISNEAVREKFNQIADGWLERQMEV